MRTHEPTENHADQSIQAVFRSSRHATDSFVTTLFASRLVALLRPLSLY